MITYLCGGMHGLSDAECRDWRELAKARLITGTLDPMRRDYRGREADNVDAIVAGDFEDIERSRFLLVNAARPSWGTAMEMKHAHDRGITVVVFNAPEKPSPWLRYHSHAMYRSLDAAVEHINAAVTP